MIAIAGVHVRSWQVGYRGMLPDAVLDGLRPGQRIPRWTAILAATSWPERGTLVVEDDHTGVVGFAAMGLSRDGAQDTAVTCESFSLYVGPAGWRRGAGGSLMTATLSAPAARYERCTLWVLATNVRARRFYAAHGWRPDGAVRADAVGGVDVDEVRLVHDQAGVTG